MKSLLLSLAMFLCASAGLQAQFYLGASAGNSFINKSLEDANGGDFKVDDNAFAYKIFAGFGYRFLSLEGGYRDLGEVQSESGQTTLQTSITGWDAALRAKLHLGPIFAFAKAGSFWAKYENEVNGVDSDENSTNFLWGAGLGVQIRKLGIRAEYEGMGESDNGLSMLTGGLTFQIGGKKKEDK